MFLVGLASNLKRIETYLICSAADTRTIRKNALFSHIGGIHNMNLGCFLLREGY